MPLDPDFRRILDRLAEAGVAGFHRGTAEEARQAFRNQVHAARARPGYVLERVGGVDERKVDGPAGQIPVQVYTPLHDRGRVVTYLHGGGWVIGDLDTHDSTCRRIANSLGAMLVSVDYRLAPEHPFPAALDDTSAAVEWTAEKYPERAHIVAGDSAGAALAVGAAMRARDGGPRLAAQLLIYPPSDPTMVLPSVQQNGAGYLLTRADMAWFMDHYAPDPAMRADPAIDLLNADLAGLPPAVVATAELDPLRDDGDALAARLQAAGVPVSHIPGPGLIHGYFSFAGSVPAAAATCRRVLAAVDALLP